LGIDLRVDRRDLARNTWSGKASTWNSTGWSIEIAPRFCSGSVKST
jgi:hypothetical protein